jgi:hypothetical protein
LPGDEDVIDYALIRCAKDFVQINEDLSLLLKDLLRTCLHNPFVDIADNGNQKVEEDQRVHDHHDEPKDPAEV